MTTNSKLQARRIKAVPRAVATATSVFADRAENAEIWDVEGKRYIDFAGGIAVLAVGHRHPRVIAAVKAQLDRFTHTAFQVMAYEPYIELSERLSALAPFGGKASTLLFTTGGEAVENAVKIARRATGRSGVIAFTGSFHGRSLLGMAMTGKVTPYKFGFGSLPEVHHVPFPGESSGYSVAESLRALDFLLSADIHPSQVAAIVIEPMQGEGGFYPAPIELLKSLRTLCDQHGIILIADEVQTGFARTGRMFAIEHSGVEPDLIAAAKSMGGGFPLSGVIGRAEIMDMVEPGGLGGTYAGAPLSCAAGLAVLDIIEEEGLITRASAIGDRLRARLGQFVGRNDLVPISAPRGLGAMIGFDVLAEGDPMSARAVAARALEAGLVILTCGPTGQSIRILLPLTASDAIIDEGLDILESALRVVPDGR